MSADSGKKLFVGPRFRRIRHTLAENGARRLWELLHSEDFVPTLGTFTGNQAVQQVKAGLKAIYLSGWQVAADANTSGNMYPDQSLYPVDSVPAVIKRINRALERADQIQTMERLDGKGGPEIDYFVPIIAFISSKALSGPPKPASASAMIGTK